MIVFITHNVYFDRYYCIISVPHPFNSHISMNTNPFITKAIHMLLVHGFGTLNTLIPGLFARNKLKHNKQIKIVKDQ